MRIAVLALALLPAAALAQDRSPPAAAPVALAGARECENARTHRAAQPPATVAPRPLGREPLANRYLGVMRLVDGCEKPVKVAEKVGNEQR